MKIIIQSIVAACKILVNHKLDSGPFGNVSIRVPNSATCYINPEHVTFENMSDADIVLMDLEGKVIVGNHLPHPGAFIHREIYRLRSDVQAIVHTHARHTVLLSLTQETLKPFTQLGAAFHNDQSVYQGFSGPVRDSNEGHAIAKALEHNSLVIAKNHGLFTVGPSIQTALWDFIVANEAATIQCQAKAMGIVSAEDLSIEDYHKSREQVRTQSAEMMWRNFMLNKMGGI
jgi:L-ribulose-5-phosphate 4-epimerase